MLSDEARIAHLALRYLDAAAAYAEAAELVRDFDPDKAAVYLSLQRASLDDHRNEVGNRELTQADLTQPTHGAHGASELGDYALPRPVPDTSKALKRQPPAQPLARAAANVAALRTLRHLQDQARTATDEERETLALWSGWGALASVFDEHSASYAQFEGIRGELALLLSSDELAAAKRSTLNAHYTDPNIASAVWSALEKLGFERGRVLEPGCGSGNFVELALPGANMVGIELDPITASIAAARHPMAQIHAESFAESRFAEGSFDAVVGNVPFGDVVLHDKRHNNAKHSIHNHFILKSLQLTKPGGVVAVITSRYTMDAANPAARREMAELADLLGAVRLPTGAHRRTAGTDVVTDVLLLRRREAGKEAAGEGFERSMRLEGSEALEQLRVNEYFEKHPNQVLGTLRATQAERGRLELDVVQRGGRPLQAALTEALFEIANAAQERGLAHAPLTSEHAPVAQVISRAHQPEGYLALDSGGRFTRVEEGFAAPYRPPAAQAAELRALVGLRDTVVALLEAEAASNDDSGALDEQRQRLNAQYDAYVAAHGAINRFTERSTGRVDPETGEVKLARIRPRQGGFRSDPYANVVYALEHFDSSTQSATKATVFHERVVCRREPRLGAETAEDALAICLDTVGAVQLDEVARLLGVDADEARRELGTLVFDEPDSRRLVPAAEYLSGNVRAKLRQAERAQCKDTRFAANVQALREVLPRDLAPDEIQAQLGAAWIDRAYVEEFLREILEDRRLTVEHAGGAIWTVHSGQLDSVHATSQWGTERCPAPHIAQALLEQRAIRVYDLGSDGERTFNADATDEANQKASEMAERFSEWVWEKPERGAKLAAIYNERFNAIVPRSYDGAQLSLPGLAVTFKPRPHQVAAVARVIHEPAVGLFHEVGAGKTAEMVMGAMELRRLGLANKPVIVVPNHMLEQFSREWLQMYPQAKLLAASREDLSRDNRRLFQARCATGDWDGIVMTRSAFERIPMSPQAQKAYLEREVAAIDAMLDKANASGAGYTRKRLEKVKLRAEERIKTKLDGVKDPGLTFEMLGIDYIFADEAHAYKNLRTSSNIPGMAVDGSQRASDLHMKIEYLRERGGRVATLATATPIANSMGEAYTMQRYLRPDLLEQSGISDFDQWAATFGKTVTAIEVAADGSGMRQQTRFASFRNVPELLQQWQVSADIKTAEDLKLPVPALKARADGTRAPEVVVVAPSPTLSLYVEDLARRADRVRGRSVDPSQDNLLKISSDGRAAGLDVRLVGAETEVPQKLDVAAERIAAIYQEHKCDVFLGSDGKAHPRPGGLQLVFCDLGTPKEDAWNVYDAMRAALIARGLPPQAVRFIHEARDDREKGELFAACRDGRVAVLFGSTERMGVGTNVQLRAVALHHMDCPWRPADIAQREGRILRQGNANAEVQILRYVTEGSFDGYLWQTVSRKAQFIGQVMRGRLDVREIEDIGDAALSYHEVKALAAGNPLLLEHARMQAEVTRFERLQRAHTNKQNSLRWTLERSERAVSGRQVDAKMLGMAMAQLTEQAQDGLKMEVRGHRCTKSAEGNAKLRSALQEYAVHCARSTKTPPALLGHLYGFEIRVQPALLQGEVVMELGGVPGSNMTLEPKELVAGLPLTRLEHRLHEMPAQLASANLDVVRYRSEIQRAEEELVKPFRFAEPLVEGRKALREIEEQLRGHDASETQHAEPTRCSAATGEATAGSTQLEALTKEAERLTGRPIGRVPEGRFEGQLVSISAAPSGRRHAIVATATHAHILTASRDLEALVGQRVSIDRSDGRVTMVPLRARDTVLER